MMNRDISSNPLTMDTDSSIRTRSVRSQEYELLLEDCIDLYEELEDAMESIDLLISEITLAAEDIRDTFENIDQNLAACTRRLRRLNMSEYRRNMAFQGSFEIPTPEAGREETAVTAPQGGDLLLSNPAMQPALPEGGNLRARGPEGMADGAANDTIC